MKPKLILILLLACSMSSNAQFRIHAGGGANFSNISFKNIQAPELNSATNYFLSIRPEIGLNELFSIGLDIQFSRKGYTYEEVINVPVAGYRFQYLDLIPQAQFRFIKPLAIYGGLGIGIRTSEKTNIGDVWNEAKTKLSKPADFTYVAGLRVFPFKRFSLQAQFAGSLGSFLDIEFTNATGVPIPNVTTKLNNIQLGVAYQLY